MTELPQTLSNAFQRFTESNPPLFSWHRDLLNHPDHLWFVLIAFLVGAILGLGLNLYREHIRNDYVIFEGFPLMLIPTFIGGVLGVLIYMFAVPLIYLAVLLLISAVIVLIVWDGYRVSREALWRILKPAMFTILGWLIVLLITGVMVVWKLPEIQAIQFSWNYQTILFSLCLYLLLGLFFGGVGHILYADKSTDRKLFGSSLWATSIRYPHISLLWAIGWPFYDLVIKLSTSHFEKQFEIVTRNYDNRCRGYDVQIDQLLSDVETIERKSKKQVGQLNARIVNRDSELNRLREANKKMSDRVGILNAEIETLNEQNRELHQQWIDALQNTGVVDDGVVDLDDLFTDED